MADEPTLSRELLDECERVALRVAPEVAAAPLYAMGVPSGYPDTGTCAAFTSAGAPDFALRDSLIGEGRWVGPGTVVAFCGTPTRDEVLGLMIHEIAHKVPFVAPPDDVEPSAAVKAAQRILIACRFARPVDDSRSLPRWFKSHGLDFVRRCLHLHFRAWQAGYEIGIPAIAFAGEQYHLAPAWRYKSSLRDEPQRMETATFADIAATNPPAEFCQLFRSDFEDWCEHRQQTENENAANAA